MHLRFIWGEPSGAKWSERRKDEENIRSKKVQSKSDLWAVARPLHLPICPSHNQNRDNAYNLYYISVTTHNCCATSNSFRWKTIPTDRIEWHTHTKATTAGDQSEFFAATMRRCYAYTNYKEVNKMRTTTMTTKSKKPVFKWWEEVFTVEAKRVKCSSAYKSSA